MPWLKSATLAVKLSFRENLTIYMEIYIRIRIPTVNKFLKYGLPRCTANKRPCQKVEIQSITLPWPLEPFRLVNREYSQGPRLEHHQSGRLSRKQLSFKALTYRYCRNKGEESWVNINTRFKISPPPHCAVL